VAEYRDELHYSLQELGVRRDYDWREEVTKRVFWLCVVITAAVWTNCTLVDVLAHLRLADREVPGVTFRARGW
jgi:hypothetical protein